MTSKQFTIFCYAKIINISSAPFLWHLQKYSILEENGIVVARRVKSYQWAADVVGILMSFRFWDFFPSFLIFLAVQKGSTSHLVKFPSGLGSLTTGNPDLTWLLQKCGNFANFAKSLDCFCHQPSFSQEVIMIIGRAHDRRLDFHSIDFYCKTCYCLAVINFTQNCPAQKLLLKSSGN